MHTAEVLIEVIQYETSSAVTARRVITNGGGPHDDVAQPMQHMQRNALWLLAMISGILLVTSMTRAGRLRTEVPGNTAKKKDGR